MRISFDLDGTAWKYRKEFSALAHLLKNSGHEIGILTAHSPALKFRDIELWLARGFPAPDFYYCNENKEPVSQFKAGIMSKFFIDVHFEDFDAGDYEDAFMKELTYGTVIRIR